MSRFRFDRILLFRGRANVPGPRGHNQLQLERLEERKLLTAGMLDPTFGMGGRVVSSYQGLLSGGATSAVVQPNGDIVTASWAVPLHTTLGQFALTRTNPDGTPDTTFGNDGKVVTQFKTSILNDPVSVALQPNGQIVVAGTFGVPHTSLSGMVVARFNANGSVDTTFGMDGIDINTLPTENSYGYIHQVAAGVAVQSNGQIVVVGTQSTLTAILEVYSSFCLIRFNANGVLDTTFGTGGEVTTSILATNHASAVAIQPDGDIVVAGTVSTSVPGPFISPGVDQIGVARYLPDGSPDTTFGTMGTEELTPNANGGATASALVLQPNNDILIAGATQNAPSLALLVSLTPNGTLDTSFNQTGVVATGLSLSGQLSLALQANGQIVLAGSAQANDTTPSQLALVRYNLDGSRDASFGQNGEVLTSFGSMGSATASAVSIEPNQNIVVAGSFAPSATSLNTSAALAQYNPGGSLDTSFGSSGETTVAFPGRAPVTINAVALQGNGQIIVAGGIATPANDGNIRLGSQISNFQLGDVAVARFNSHGSLDTSFGQDGWTVFDVAGLGSAATALAVLPNGQILVAGIATISAAYPYSNEFFLAELNPDGSLDTAFGNQGLVTASGIAGVATILTSLLVQPDGKIVEVGQANPGQPAPPYPTEIVLIRYNADGSLDTSFGANGIATSPVHIIDPAKAAAGGAVLQPNGAIVVVGPVGNGSGLLRFTPSGSLDPTFGTAGQVSFFGFGVTVALQPNGDLVEVGGTGNSEFSDGFALARYTSNGTLDTSFGNGGMVSATIGGPGVTVVNKQATSVVIESNGKILVGGLLQKGGPDTPVFALARYNADGSLDAGFGTNGQVTTTFSSGAAQINAMLLQPDGSLLVAGSEPQPLGEAGYLALSNVDLARYLLPPPSQNELFVDQVYLDLLKRPVDQVGFTYFLNGLDDGVFTRTQVVQLIEGSQEYRTDQIEGLYMSYLKRPADPDGLQSWLSLLNSGATIEQIKSGILGSQEYFQEQGGTNASYLQAVYEAVLSRPIDPTGAADWGAELANGVSRTQVAFQILSSTEAYDDLITSVYESYLHRAPERGGMAYWLGQSQTGLTNENFVAGVVGSNEFYADV
jgi:uncharacterized delta-60 repeat protein